MQSSPRDNSNHGCARLGEGLILTMSDAGKVQIYNTDRDEWTEMNDFVSGVSTIGVALVDYAGTVLAFVPGNDKVYSYNHATDTWNQKQGSLASTFTNFANVILVDDSQITCTT